MGIFDDHPYTAVTAIINRVIVNSDGTSSDGIIETELPELLEAIRLQKATGATEAARAIRKKLKHGSFPEQWKSLNVLELLVANGGHNLRALYNDERLLDRISYCILAKSATVDVDPRIKKRCVQLAIGWKQEYDGSPDRQGLTQLYTSTGLNRVFQKKRHSVSRRGGGGRRTSVVPDFMNDEADLTTPFDEEYETDTASSSNASTIVETESRASSSSRSFLPRVKHSDNGGRSKNSRQSAAATGGLKSNKELDKKFRIPKINVEKERPTINKIIAEGTSNAIMLTNTLTALDYSHGELSIHSAKANDEFDQCRAVRRKVLRCLQLVNTEDLLGPLLHANDELVKALQKYEEFSKPPAGYVSDDDYDEEDSLANYESESDYDLESIVDSLATENEGGGFGTTNQSVHSMDLRGHRPPPPPPPKPNKLRSQKVQHPPHGQQQQQRQQQHASHYDEIDEDDPFNDGNEVNRPVQWR